MSLHAGGWLEMPDATDEMVSMLATEIVELAHRYARFGVGTVIERDGEDLQRDGAPSGQAVASCATREVATGRTSPLLTMTPRYRPESCGMGTAHLDSR